MPETSNLLQLKSQIYGLVNDPPPQKKSGWGHHFLGNLHTVFLKCAMDIPVPGPILQTEAKETAQMLPTEHLQVSSGRLELFKMQYGNFHISSGESAVDMQTDEEWKSKQRKVMSEYPTLNQFMADKMKNVNAGNSLTRD